MDEYISREEVLKKFLERGSGYINELTMRDMINEIPAADVQPIKHGRWITKAENYYKAWQDSGRSWDDMPYFVTGLKFACSNCFEQLR